MGGGDDPTEEDDDDGDMGGGKEASVGRRGSSKRRVETPDRGDGALTQFEVGSGSSGFGRDLGDGGERKN